jgi:hypothetical protein
MCLWNDVVATQPIDKQADLYCHPGTEVMCKKMRTDNVKQNGEAAKAPLLSARSVPSNPSSQGFDVDVHTEQYQRQTDTPP